MATTVRFKRSRLPLKAILAAAGAALVLPGAADAAAPGPEQSACKPISLVSVHGAKEKPRPYCRLTPITNGTVPCNNTITGTFRSCTYTHSSGTWLTGKDGTAFAVVGDLISRAGKATKHGRYQVASRFKAGELPPCLKRVGKPTASAADGLGTQTTTDGAAVCQIETLNSPFNSGLPLISYSRNPICVSNSTHPDGAAGGWNGEYYCYHGSGAALVDQYGMEFDQNGRYYPASGQRCHVYQYTVNGIVYQGIAMKAPSLTRTNPAQIIKGSLYRWQPYRSTADAIDGM